MNQKGLLLKTLIFNSYLTLLALILITNPVKSKGN